MAKIMEINDLYMELLDFSKYNLPSNLVRVIYKIAATKKPVCYDSYRCIFVHIPKTAGVSVSKALFGRGPGHRPIMDYKILEPQKFTEYFKFSFVRNPWSRLLSCYTYFNKGGRGKWDEEVREKYLSNCSSFADFVYSLTDNAKSKEITKHVHFMPYYKYLCDNNFKIQVDFVGRTENLERDFQYVVAKLGTEAKLEHLNKSSNVNYQEMYSEEMKQIVGKLYQKDIEIFNYEF